MDLQSYPVATNGYHPVPTTGNTKTLDEDYEKLKLENLNYKQRCEQLEQLVKDLISDIKRYGWSGVFFSAEDMRDYSYRLNDLGLVE